MDNCCGFRAAIDRRGFGAQDVNQRGARFVEHKRRERRGRFDPALPWRRARDRALLPRALIGMVALLLGNAFIVGINQIYDEKIDKMNKPFLPVASGEMSKKFAWATVLSAGIAGPLIV